MASDPYITSENFERHIETIESDIENLLRFQWAGFGDQDASGRLPLIFERLTLVQNAIDDWRQG